jgi:hypothetical protein
MQATHYTPRGIRRAAAAAARDGAHTARAARHHD